MASGEPLHIESLAEMLRSHERLDDERWMQNERRWEETSRAHAAKWDETARAMMALEERQAAGFNGVNIKIDGLSQTYSSRFWNLAMSIIGTLGIALVSLAWKFLTHGR